MAHSGERQIMRYKWLNCALVWFQNYEQVSWLDENVIFSPQNGTEFYICPMQLKPGCPK